VAGVDDVLIEMAYGAATLLLEIDPTNRLARECLRRRRKKHGARLSKQEIEEIEKKLEEGYQALKIEAKILKVELASNYFQNIAEDQDTILANLHSISKGDVASAVSVNQPVSVREAAREIMASPQRATELILEDLETVVRWLTGHLGEIDAEKLREKVVKRRAFLEAALPESMQQECAAAFRQVEREHLEKKYANTETMYGDKIEDIPRSNFFASEDNYAWDMEELAAAIRAQGGVMRNPLSKQMFSESDIETILSHPLGQQLRPLQEAQHRLKKGVRSATITKIESLGNVMLTDQSMDARPSRTAIEEFLAFVATLPSSERQTIRELKIEAVDRNTGQPFDYSISESVNDAKAGVTCYHKVGWKKSLPKFRDDH
jgi:hypothetical protein